MIEELAAQNAGLGEWIKLRFFVGRRIPDAVALMGISPTTAKCHWTYARAWLFVRLKSRD